MAGKVRTVVRRGTDPTRIYITPQPCAIESRYWSGNDCAAVDTHSAWVNLCPFLYGLQAARGGCLLELRSAQEIMAHVATADIEHETYICLCLRKESAGTEAGARLRS